MHVTDPNTAVGKMNNKSQYGTMALSAVLDKKLHQSVMKCVPVLRPVRGSFYSTVQKITETTYTVRRATCAYSALREVLHVNVIYRVAVRKILQTNG